MERQVVILLFGTVIGLTIASIAFITWKSRRRSRKLSRLGRELGWAYQADGSAIVNDGFAELPLFALGASGSRGTISNLITGNIGGASVTVCDYAYRTGSVTTQRFDYAQTVVCFRLEADRYPSFTLHPRGGLVQETSMNLARGSVEMLAAIATPLAAKDERWKALKNVIEHEQGDSIEIDGHPEFSKQYRLFGSDREAVKRLFGPAVFESLQYDGQSLCVESSGLWLAIYRKNKQIEPANIVKFLTKCVQLKRALLVDQ